MQKKYLFTLSVTFVVFNLSAAVFPKDSILSQDTLLSGELNEVIVSAGRMPQKLSTIPTAITLISHKELSRMTESSMNLNEILSLTVPGLAPPASGYSNWGQTLRGRKLLTMIDGVPISTTLRPGQVDINNINPNDLERVEVIKGSSAIYGNGGDGGFINYITRTYSGEKVISGTTQLWGSLNLSKVKDALGGGLHQSLRGKVGRFHYVTSLGYENTGSQYDARGVPLFPIYGGDNTQKYTAFGKLTYQLADNQQLTLSTNYYRARQDSPFEPVLSELKVFNSKGSYQLIPGYGKRKKDNYPEEPMGPTSISSLLKYNLSDLFNQTTLFTTDIYYQKSKNIFFYSKSFEQGGQSVINSEKIGLRPNFLTNLETDILKTSFIYGIDMLRDRTNQALLDGRIWIPNMQLTSVAPYLQANFQIRDQVVIKGGLRYDAMFLNIGNYRTLPYSPKQDGNFNSPVSVTGGTMNFDRLSLNVGIRYIPNISFVPYFSFSQGFSLPDVGRILRETDNPDVVRQLTVKAIATNNFEIGFMTDLKILRIEASAYYSNSNMGTGLAFNDESNRFEQVNSPQYIFGGEISVDSHLLRNKLLIGSSFSWVEGLTRKTKDDKMLVYVGGDVIAAPKLTGYLSYQVNRKFTSNINVIYVGNRERFNPILIGENKWKYNNGEAPVRGYALVNVSLSYSLLPNLKTSFAINNLLNHYYLPARSQWAAPLRNQTGGAGEGINSKLTLQYDF